MIMRSAIITGVVLGVMFALAPATGLAPVGTLPPCPTEDSTGCYWDAQTMGNGVGNDVVTH